MNRIKRRPNKTQGSQIVLVSPEITLSHTSSWNVGKNINPSFSSHSPACTFNKFLVFGAVNARREWITRSTVFIGHKYSDQGLQAEVLKKFEEQLHSHVLDIMYSEVSIPIFKDKYLNLLSSFMTP